MRLLHRATSFFRRLLRERQIDAQLDDELQSTLDLIAEQKIRDGLPRDQAVRAAKIELGGVEQVKEQVRSARTGASLDTLFRDVRFSLRILRKNWKIAAVGVFSLSIAMAIGVLGLSVSNTAILVPVSGVSPERLVTIYQRSPDKSADEISAPDYEYYRDNNRVFTDVAAIPQSVSIDSESGQATYVYSSVSQNYFSVLGIRPQLGRFFLPSDRDAKPPVSVLSYSCWTRLGSDPNIVGKTVDSRTVVGVAPKEFTGNLFGLNGDILFPMSAQDAARPRNDRTLLLLARLKPGVTRQEAQADLALLSAQLARAYPKDDKDRTAILTRTTLLPPEALPAAEVAVAVLILLVVLVLLIACANVGNLLLALAVGRRRETAVKLALGASRARLMRESLTQSAVICAFSGLLGSALAVAAVRRYSTVTIDVPQIGAYSFSLKLHLGIPVVAGAFALICIAALATGLPAALYASSPAPAGILTGETNAGRVRKRFRRNGLVVIQIAVCTLVLVGMGLCERSLYNLRHVNLGFSARNLVAETLFLGGERFTAAKAKEDYSAVRRAVQAIPGVEAVTFSAALPLLSNGSEVPVQLSADAKPASFFSTAVDTDYFSTFGIPLLSGRVFTAADTSPDRDALLINHRLAEALWPGQNAVGRAVLTGNPARPGVVVGIVGDTSDDAIDQQPQPHLYYALSQHYQPQIDVVARTAGDPRGWVAPLAAAIDAAGFHSVFHPITFEAWENVSLFTERAVAGCVAVFSALGLLLALVGLFGAVSYSVSERKKELGIRVALGAQRAHLLAMILRQTGLIAATGALIGLILGVGATILARSQLYGIASLEWSVLIPVAATMLAVSLAVAALSAWPWIKANPMDAIRSE